jgi:MFS family permease
MFGAFFLGSLYLERVLGYSPLEIGLAFLPLTVAMGALSVRYSEPLITRFGARQVVLAGLTLLTAGLALFARVPVDGNYWIDVLPTEVLLGAGAGLCFPALMGLAMSGAAPTEAGLASGLINTTAQVGGALGLAVLATLSSTHSEHLAAAGSSGAAALAGGYRLAFVIAAALAAAAVVAAAALFEAPPRTERMPAAEPEMA